MFNSCVFCNKVILNYFKLININPFLYLFVDKYKSYGIYLIVYFDFLNTYFNDILVINIRVLILINKGFHLN